MNLNLVFKKKLKKTVLSFIFFHEKIIIIKPIQIKKINK